MCTLEKRGNLFILTFTGDGTHGLNPTLIDSIRTALQQVKTEAKPGSALITTAQGKFYSNGLDLVWAKATAGPTGYNDRVLGLVHSFKPIVADLLSLPIPTIAAVTGHAAAAGFMFALSHDYVLMNKSRGVLYMSGLDIGFPFPDYFMALTRSKISSPIGRRDVGLGAAKINAERGVELGFIDSAYDSVEETIEAALRLGEKLGARNWKGDVYLDIRKATFPEICESVGLNEKSMWTKVQKQTRVTFLRGNLQWSLKIVHLHIMCTLEKSGNLFILTLTGDNEHRLNPTLIQSIRTALHQIRTEAKSGSALITTAQGKFFSNGFDLTWAQSAGSTTGNKDRQTELILSFKSIIADLLSLPLPTIAAISGHAVAAGFMFALSHDYVLMRKDRGFVYMSELDIGLTFSDYFMVLMKSKISSWMSRRDLVLQSSKMKAERAVELGIIDSAYDTLEETIDAALRLGEKLAARKWNGEVYADIRKATYPEISELLGLIEYHKPISSKL